MRKGYSTPLRLDSLPIDQVPLNLECRSRIVPILRAVQQVYSKVDVTAAIMRHHAPRICIRGYRMSSRCDSNPNIQRFQ